MTTVPILKPELRDIMDAIRRETMAALNCVQIGEITAYDAAANTASVAIKSVKQFADGSTLEYPELGDCPVFILGGGGAALSMPIASGDTCLVLFADRDIDTWHYTGSTDVPNTNRMHSISDAIVLVGVRPSTNPVVATGGIVHLKAAESVRFESDEQVEIAVGDAAVSVGTTRAQVDGGAGKVALKNQAQSMFTILNSLIDQIVALTVTCNVVGTPSSVPINGAAFAAIKAQLALLMDDGA